MPLSARYPSMQTLRFLVTASAGLIVDIAAAITLITAFGVADIPAAAAGLAAGMVFNYFVHQAWTFRHPGARRSFRQFAQYALSVLVTLAVRGGFLAGLAAVGLADVLPAALRLFLGAAVSFGVSYSLCRNFVFTRDHAVMS